MIGKIIGAAIGGAVARQTSKIDGTTGAMIGAAIPFVMRRMSIPGMIALGVGGYVVKKYLDRQEMPQPADKDTVPVASIPAPKAK